MSDQPDPAEIQRRLAEPFDATEVRFKPQVVQGNRALALGYVDARVIQDRLDDVLGVDGWQDEYEVLPDGAVVCRLRCKLGGEWITKVDVGSPSEQPDGGDRMKAAFSDSLKRSATKFGIGRYLYRLPSQWVDYDPVKRQFTRTPTLPPSALPKGQRLQQPAARPAAATPATQSAAPAGHTQPPANGEELLARLLDYEAGLVKSGVCAEGQLLGHIAEAGDKAGLGLDIKAWGKPGVRLAAKETKAFEAKHRKPAPAAQVQPQKRETAAAGAGSSGPYAERR